MLDDRNWMSIILSFINLFILSIAFEVKIEISEVTVFSNSSEKLVKAKYEGAIKEMVTMEIVEIIINVLSFNLGSVDSQTLIL